MKGLTPEEYLLIRLVRKESIGSSLLGCKADLLLALATRHKVIFPLAARITEEKQANAFWLSWASKIALCAEHEANICAKARTKTIELLESRGIRCIVIKGVSLSLGKRRDAGDVDILIPEASLLDAISILESVGYIYRGFDRNLHIRTREARDWKGLSRWSVQFEFTEPDSGILFELHTAFFETARVYDEDLSTLRSAIKTFAAASAIDQETGFRFLSLEDRVLLLALHVGLKRSPSRREFILRHLIDLRTLVDAGLDWMVVERQVFRYGVAHHLLLLLQLNERILGSLEFAAVEQRLKTRLPPQVVGLVKIHVACLIGLEGFSKLAAFTYRFLSPFIIKSRPIARLRALLIFPLILPEPIKLRKIYGLHPRTKWAYLFYLLEPIRGFMNVIAKIFKILHPGTD